MERMDGLLLWCITYSTVTGSPWHLLWDLLMPKLSGGVNQAPAGNLALVLFLCVCMLDLSPTRLCTFFARPERWSNRKSSNTLCQKPWWPTLPCSAAAALLEAGPAAPALSVPSNSTGWTREVPKELWRPWKCYLVCCRCVCSSQPAWKCCMGGVLGLWAGSAGKFCLGSVPGACQGSACAYASANQFFTWTSK